MLRLFSTLIFLAMLSCNDGSSTTSNNADTTNKTVENRKNTVPDNTTPDNDQGCNIANGEKWSDIKKSCIVLAEQISLRPMDTKLDKDKPAYLIFDSVRVEILLPTQEKSVIIRRTSAIPEVWENGPLKLTKTSAGYKLEDEGKLIYGSNK